MHPKTTSDQGINLIKKFEGLAKEQDDGMIVPYRCAANVLTIGYGSTKGVKEGDTITQEEADSLLLHEMDEYEGYINDMIILVSSSPSLSKLAQVAYPRLKSARYCSLSGE